MSLPDLAVQCLILTSIDDYLNPQSGQLSPKSFVCGRGWITDQTVG